MNRLTVKLLAFVLLFCVMFAQSGCGASGTAGRSIETRADHVLEALYERDWSRLAEHAHPERGVLFSPSAYVDRENAVVLHRNQLNDQLLTDSSYVWGHEDGTGDVIAATPTVFLKEYVLDRDFRDAQRGPRDETLGVGNTTSNVPDVFLDRRADTAGEVEIAFIEYHDPGTEAFGGMDWASLRVVFERMDGTWYLIAIVRDEWTI
jgi:hypothetical protein